MAVEISVVDKLPSPSVSSAAMMSEAILLLASAGASEGALADRAVESSSVDIRPSAVRIARLHQRTRHIIDRLGRQQR